MLKVIITQSLVRGISETPKHPKLQKLRQKTIMCTTQCETELFLEQHIRKLVYYFIFFWYTTLDGSFNAIWKGKINVDEKDDKSF